MSFVVVVASAATAAAVDLVATIAIAVTVVTVAIVLVYIPSPSPSPFQLTSPTATSRTNSSFLMPPPSPSPSPSPSPPPPCSLVAHVPSRSMSARCGIFNVHACRSQHPGAHALRRPRCSAPHRPALNAPAAPSSTLQPCCCRRLHRHIINAIVTTSATLPTPPSLCRQPFRLRSRRPHCRSRRPTAVLDDSTPVLDDPTPVLVTMGLDAPTLAATPSTVPLSLHPGRPRCTVAVTPAIA
ncbi:hypothetical protein OF83DRAFT_1179591 [Amylostereum chailletii]|nr:hypothetical protein OF83DRAFT_1179591 [Amylostereum chailletii]